jgi:hypothetical protein
MPLLDQFAPPGDLEDLSPVGRQAWSEALQAVFGRFTRDFVQFIDPTETEVPDDADVALVSWGAFPATQRSGTPEQRWQRVDADRDLQDEYCEWSVERDGAGEVRAVTFTTETPDYYAHLFAVDADAALGLYEQFVGRRVTARDLRTAAGEYDKNNAFNTRVDGPIVHLRQASNTLAAAVQLAAEATILRERDGQPVTDAQSLVACGGLGEPLRNSDPQIAAAVNNLAAEGRDITLAAPPGLYITDLMTNGIQTRDGTDPKTLWSIRRGSSERALRGRFEIPDELVGGVTVSGRPLRFGSQLAERVGVGLSVVSFPAGRRPTREPCRS